LLSGCGEIDRGGVRILQREAPLGDPIPINFDTFDIWDEMSEDAEIGDVVKELKNGMAGGASEI